MKKCQNTENGEYYCAIIMKYSSDLIDSLKMSLGSWMSLTHTLRTTFLIYVVFQSCNGSSQPRLLLGPVSTCLLVISRLIVSYALTDGKISNVHVAKVTFQFLEKDEIALNTLWNLESWISDLYVISWPVVCSPWWYPVSQMLDPWWWCFGDSGRAQEGPESDYFMFSTHTMFLQQTSPLPL